MLKQYSQAVKDNANSTLKQTRANTDNRRRARSQRVSLRADGTPTFRTLNAYRWTPQKTFRVPARNENATAVTDAYSGAFNRLEPLWAVAESVADTYIVVASESISPKGVIRCASERAAWETETVVNTILFLDSQRAEGDCLVFLSASAPASPHEGDKLDHVSYLTKRLTRKCRDADIEPRILRVSEADGSGYHAHFVIPFPADRVSLLTDLTGHEKISQFGVPGVGTALDVRVAYDAPGLAGYLTKATRHGIEIEGVGGSRVFLNTSLTRAMSDANCLQPAR